METRYYYSRRPQGTTDAIISDALDTHLEVNDAMRAGSLQYPDDKHEGIMVRWKPEEELPSDTLWNALWNGRMPPKIREDLQSHNLSFLGVKDGR